MKKILYNTLKVLTVLSTALVFSCSEDPTPSIYELPAGDLPTPVISGINPSTEALAGVTKITITGSNFVANPKYNLVYFNGRPATVLSATSTQLELIPPVVISDTVIVKIALAGGNPNFSNEINYKLKPAVAELYPFDVITKGEMPYGITVDASENVYLSMADMRTGGSGGKGIKKIDASGIISDFAPKGSESFFSTLNFGPDNAIYATRKAKGVIQVQAGSTPTTFLSTGIQQVIVDIDFDANDNIWAVCDSNLIYRITLSKQAKAFPYTGKARACKIVGDYLYVASLTNFKERILKFRIFSQDSLGLAEDVFDFSTVADTLKITDIAISQDGDLYVGTDKPVDPIYILHPNNVVEVLYPGLINSSVFNLYWGNGNFLY
ncbi:MAG: IPT/TIG domain-containing protein, partial [Ignavibacteria bacterium]|nr:IPT/TIG domain-containing protein [Ignavibacteria bacterium]